MYKGCKWNYGPRGQDKAFSEDMPWENNLYIIMATKNTVDIAYISTS